MRTSLLILFTLLFSANAFCQVVIKPTIKVKLLVYYFHLTNRCNTCKKIEAATIKTLETYFKKELENGTIVFQSFNVDLPENKKLVEKYQAYGATLALTPLVKGQEADIEDITDFAFSKIGNEEIFINELREKIISYLK